MREREAGQRRCLKCQKYFPSTGSGNRICCDCSNLNKQYGATAAYREQGAKRWNGLAMGESFGKPGA